MSRLIILRGNSACGKTTTAIGLKKSYGEDAMLISLDYIKNTMLTVKNNRFILNELLFQLAAFGKKYCKVVIIEGIFNSKKYFDLFQKLNLLFKDNVYAFYFDIPFEETLLRHKNRLESKEFGEIEMRKWWHDKDLLKNIPEMIIEKDMTIDETIDFICNVVNENK